MNLIALIILLVSLALAAGAAYWFLQWKCPTHLEKLVQIAEEIKNLALEEEDDQINNFDPEQLTELSPIEIRQAKRELTQIQKKLKETIVKAQKEIKEEDDEEEKTKKQEELEKAHELTPKLTEMVSVCQPIEKKEDFQNKFYGTWDYVYAGGIALAVFGVSWGLGNLLTKKMKGENS